MRDDVLNGLSKFLSFVLRHRPESIGLKLDANGWANIDELIGKARAHGKLLSREQIERITATNSKKRFAISEDQMRIRANQGHSVEVDLAYEPAVPPAVLFHGTPQSSVEAIRKGGLSKMQRHHVHLSADIETARVVGTRRGRAVVLRVSAGEMHAAGHTFFVSANGVWLTEHVPPQFIVSPERSDQHGGEDPEQ